MRLGFAATFQQNVSMMPCRVLRAFRELTKGTRAANLKFLRRGILRDELQI
jgi:hypothetical protein